MPDTLDQKVAKFGRQVSPGSWYLQSEKDIERYDALLPYSHYLREAWSELDLSGVLCVDGRPTLYLCAGARFTLQQKQKRHRYVWNQGLVPLLLFLTPDAVEIHSTVKKPERDTQTDRLFASDPSTLIPSVVSAK